MDKPQGKQETFSFRQFYSKSCKEKCYDCFKVNVLLPGGVEICIYLHAKVKIV